MSELHLSLIIIGLLFIAAVVAFNRWQERKYRKQAEKMFRGERQDVLFDEPSNNTGAEETDISEQAAMSESPGDGDQMEPGKRSGPREQTGSGGRIDPYEGAESKSRLESQVRAEPRSRVETQGRVEPGKERSEPRQGIGSASRQRMAPGERIEPGLGAIPPVARPIPPTASPVPGAVPPVNGQTSPPAAAALRGKPGSVHPLPAADEAVQPHDLIDEAIDLIGALRADQPMAASAVQGFVTRAQAFSKPVRCQGQDEGRWMDIQPGGRYSELKMALQLADRRGPATSADIARFVALIKQFAVDLGGSAQIEAEESAAARATALDGFCADVDVEIGVNLVAGNHTMPGTKVRALAEAAGMKLTAEGVFHLRDEHGASLFTLRNSEPRPFLPEHVKNITTRGITLLLDVPRVAHGGRVFDQMLQLGRSMAHALSGEVVDDNRKPLTDAGADSIRKQLGLIYRQMEGYGIPAGSPLALRLFS